MFLTCLVTLQMDCMTVSDTVVGHCEGGRAGWELAHGLARSPDLLPVLVLFFKAGRGKSSRIPSPTPKLTCKHLSLCKFLI